VASGNVFYASPGFTPMIILSVLALLSVSLLAQSLKGSSVSERVRQVVKAAPGGLKSKRFQNSVAALFILGVYIYLMLHFLPFWLASLLLLFFVFVYLNAAGLIQCVLLSVFSVAAIVLIFQVIFNVRLP
jgi:hypothetical protein